MDILIPELIKDVLVIMKNRTDQRDKNWTYNRLIHTFTFSLIFEYDHLSNKYFTPMKNKASFLNYPAKVNYPKSLYIFVKNVFVCFLIYNILIYYSCTKDKDDNPDSMPGIISSQSSEIVSSTGGVISTPDGLSLSIPSMAIPIDTIVSVTQYAMDEEEDIYVAAATFEPENLFLLDTANFVIPLEGDFEGITHLEIHEFTGDDPGYGMASGRYARVYEEGGHYYAKAAVYHFSGIGFSKVCHAGTINQIVLNFTARGCNEDTIYARVERKFPGVKITKQNKEDASPVEIQALLDTYFDDIGGWNESVDVPETIINKINDYTIAGRKVVLAFGPEKWSARSGKYGFYNTSVSHYRHTAILTMDNTGQIQIRNTCSLGKKIRKALGGGEVVANYPLAKLNEFRKLKQGVALEIAKCGTPGCLSDKTKNSYGLNFLPPLEEASWLTWSGFTQKLSDAYTQAMSSGFTPPKPRDVPWPSVRIYVEKAGGPPNDPCELKEEYFLKLKVSIPGYHEGESDIRLISGCITYQSNQNGVQLTGVPAFSAINAEVYDPNVDTERAILSFHPTLITGPGTYSVNADALYKNNYFEFDYEYPTIRDCNWDHMTVFSSQSGTLTITKWSNQLGGVIEGSFSVNILGILCIVDDVQQTASGTASGSFRAFLENEIEP